MKQVYISALKRQLSMHLRAAEGGEEIEIMDRARPIARISPIESTAARLETVPPEQPFSAVRKLRLPPLPNVRSLEVLAAERGSR
jgi:antitoxin (DNA-binding transcriptional repressor) of toxin-antitoxin stability system